MTNQSQNDQTKLTHINEQGHASMVDVSEKPITQRGAVAQGRVQMSKGLADKIRANDIAKGNLIDVARLAGIMGAKKTGELIPLCHPLGLDLVSVEIELIDTTMYITASAKCCGRTGIEMEALMAVSIAALTIIDMGKAVDKAMVIQGVRLIEKWGGKSGHYKAVDHE